jgi:sulfur carrier protein
MIEVHVNGEPWRLAVSATVADVVDRLTDEPRGIAVALDGSVVPRARWGSTQVAAGARIEVLTAVQGG